MKLILFEAGEVDGEKAFAFWWLTAVLGLLLLLFMGGAQSVYAEVLCLASLAAGDEIEGDVILNGNDVRLAGVVDGIAFIIGQTVIIDAAAGELSGSGRAGFVAAAQLAAKVVGPGGETAVARAWFGTRSLHFRLYRLVNCPDRFNCPGRGTGNGHVLGAGVYVVGHFVIVTEPVFWIFVLFVCYLSKVIVAYRFGGWFLGRFMPRAQRRVWSLLFGLVVFVLLAAIPYAGWALSLIVTFIGLGAVVVAFFVDQQNRRAGETAVTAAK
ncbi:MAG: hypothetical protein IPH82_01450 [Chloroflexi bacterium]|nr:hypothetical protein [Chloroflexota bacterium]